MTYTTNEEGIYTGEPVEVFEFSREGLQYWRYTSADRDITIAGNVYKVAPIKRSSVEASQELERSTLDIELAFSTDFVQEFISYPPTDRLTLVVRRLHAGDLDTESIVVWVGRVINVEFMEEKVKLKCETSATSLKRPILRRLYQLACPHVLYGDLCKVSKASHAYTGDITSKSGLDITSPAFSGKATNFFAGGFIELTRSGIVTRRMITGSNTTGTITLNLVLSEAAVGLSITAYPGCDHRIATCTAKFNNRDNYGGFPHIPGINPMGGALIF